MKADVIIVIAVYNGVGNDEIKESAEGAELRAKEGASKPDNVVKIRIEMPKKAPSQDEVALIAGKLKDCKSVGIYVVGHGYLNVAPNSSSSLQRVPTLGHLEAKDLAELISQLKSDDEHFEKLKKLNVNACCLAPNLNSVMPDLPLQSLTKTNDFLVNLAVNLFPIRPMIAGYTKYMTRAGRDRHMNLNACPVAPSLLNSGELNKEQIKQKKADIKKTANQRRETLVGVDRNSRFPLKLLNDDQKSNFKIAIQMDNDANLIRIPLEIYKNLEATEHATPQTPVVGSQSRA